MGAGGGGRCCCVGLMGWSVLGVFGMGMGSGTRILLRCEAGSITWCCLLKGVVEPGVAGDYVSRNTTRGAVVPELLLHYAYDWYH